MNSLLRQDVLEREAKGGKHREHGQTTRRVARTGRSQQDESGGQQQRD
ncbi:MAG: hypothetical protein NTW28_37040 [Candidatus Solibacter sp.]|nr:hypothetical protein [Candidatus Solibacter sp.]